MIRRYLIRRASGRGVPKALMRCAKCRRWAEARDGTLSCVCRSPRIVEG